MNKKLKSHICIILFLIFSFFPFSLSNAKEFFDTTISALLKQGYKIIKIEHINKKEYVYHLTNGKHVIVCNTGFTYNTSRCAKD